MCQFNWIVLWDCHMMFAALNCCQSQVASALPGDLITKDS
ncbi:MAG: hypothetical protein QOD75_3638 [Blastocatellia bacterium]|nr:hypothetical protein [Blastocatellia bacterium]